jgi:hypothetical protein
MFLLFKSKVEKQEFEKKIYIYSKWLKAINILI